MIEIVFGVISVALFFAVLYYRSQWLNAGAINDAAKEKIEAIEVQFAEKQAEEKKADEVEASAVDSRSKSIDFLRDSLRKN